MTPRETLELLISDAHPEDTLWRDPDGEHYILSRPGAEQRYAEEGYTRLGTIEIVREMLQDAGKQAAGAGSVIFLLVEDVKKTGREGRPFGAWLNRPYRSGQLRQAETEGIGTSTSTAKTRPPVQPSRPGAFAVCLPSVTPQF